MLSINNHLLKNYPFPNQESLLYLEKETLDQFKESDVLTYDFKYETDADLFQLYLIKKEVDERLSNPLSHLLIRYMPYSRMDRRGGEEVFTLKHVAGFINDMAFDTVVVCEPHSDVTPTLLDNVQVFDTSLSILERVKRELDFDNETDYVVYPDAGAQKRYKQKDCNTLVGYKQRDWNTGRITDFQLIGQADNPRMAIIVDDLSSYGGTFMLTAKALRDIGFTEVYLVVTHAEKVILEGELLTESSPVDKVFCSDSIISESLLVWDKAHLRNKITIIPLEDILP